MPSPSTPPCGCGLRDGLSWSGQGGGVGAALREPLAEPDGWEIDPAPGEVLERVTADLLAGSVGDFIAHTAARWANARR